jgi:modulator of FtsH protease
MIPGMREEVILQTAYAADRWTDFGVGVAGAAAALAGLVFVAVSINLSEILKYRNLPGRAALTLTLFITPLFAGILLLVPGQARTALGLELLAAGVVIGVFELVINHRSGRSDQETVTTWILARVFPTIASCGCLVVAGATLLAQAGGGLYWLVPSVVAAIVFGLVNAWVLLVEILR